MHDASTIHKLVCTKPFTGHHKGLIALIKNVIFFVICQLLSLSVCTATEYVDGGSVRCTYQQGFPSNVTTLPRSCSIEMTLRSSGYYPIPPSGVVLGAARQSISSWAFVGADKITVPSPGVKMVSSIENWLESQDGTVIDKVSATATAQSAVLYSSPKPASLFSNPASLTTRPLHAPSGVLARGVTKLKITITYPSALLSSTVSSGRKPDDTPMGYEFAPVIYSPEDVLKDPSNAWPLTENIGVKSIVDNPRVTTPMSISVEPSNINITGTPGNQCYKEYPMKVATSTGIHADGTVMHTGVAFKAHNLDINNQAIVGNAYYRIRNKDSGKLVDLSGTSLFIPQNNYEYFVMEVECGAQPSFVGTANGTLSLTAVAF